MNDLAKRRLYTYSIIGASILLVGLIVAMIIGYNSGLPGDTYQPPITEKPGDNTDDEDDDVAVVADEKFALPIKGEYKVFRHYFHSGLTDAEMVMAIVNGKSTDGVTLVSKDDSSFDVFSPISGTVKEVLTGDRGQFITIEHENVIVELHSIKNVLVSVGDTVEAGQKLATATENSFDELAGINVYLVTKVKDSTEFKRSNPLDYVGVKVSEISYKK